MTQSWREAASAAMDLLLKLAEEHAQPERAQAAIAALRALHPGTTLDLAWERNVPAEAGVHYDVLIDVGDRGTMSLAFCADRGVPWPLRRHSPQRPVTSIFSSLTRKPRRLALAPMRAVSAASSISATAPQPTQMRNCAL